MRIIAGSAKGRRLKTRDGEDTRPTTDRAREALFAMLQFEIADVRFLDLFAGSGAVGIEALSRGAASAAFVEHDRAAVRCIRENLAVTGFDRQSRLYQQDVLTAVRTFGTDGERFDIIFLDPPYNKGLEQPVVEEIVRSEVLESGGLLVVESSSKTQIMVPEGLLEEKVRDYKITRFTFLRNADLPEETI